MYTGKTIQLLSETYFGISPNKTVVEGLNVRGAFLQKAFKIYNSVSNVICGKAFF